MNALPLKSNKNTSKCRMCMTVSTFVLDILIRKTEFVTAEMQPRLVSRYRSSPRNPRLTRLGLYKNTEAQLLF